MQYKINNIEHYLKSIDKDMEILADEEEVSMFLSSCGVKKNNNGTAPPTSICKECKTKLDLKLVQLNSS